MKRSDIMNTIGKVVSAAAKAQTVASVITAFKTGGMPISALDAVEGVQGIGHADERRMQLLLIELEHAIPGSRVLIEGFLKYHFHRGTTVVERVASQWAANRFRTFVTKMGSTEGETSDELAKEVTVTETVRLKETARHQAGGVKKTVKKSRTPRESPGINNALEFLKWMAVTIASTGSGNEEAGYEKVITAFKMGGVPHMSETAQNTLKTFGNWVENLPKEFEREIEIRAARADQATVERNARPKGFWYRLIIEWRF